MNYHLYLHYKGFIGLVGKAFGGGGEGEGGRLGRSGKFLRGPPGQILLWDFPPFFCFLECLF